MCLHPAPNHPMLACAIRRGEEDLRGARALGGRWFLQCTAGSSVGSSRANSFRMETGPKPMCLEETQQDPYAQSLMSISKQREWFLFHFRSSCPSPGRWRSGAHFPTPLLHVLWVVAPALLSCSLVAFGCRCMPCMSCAAHTGFERVSHRVSTPAQVLVACGAGMQTGCLRSPAATEQAPQPPLGWIGQPRSCLRCL